MVKAMMLLWIKMASHCSYFWIKMASHHSYFAEFFLLSGYQGCFCRLPLSLKPEISFGGIRPKSSNSSMRANSRTKGVRLTLVYVLAFLRCHLSAREAQIMVVHYYKMPFLGVPIWCYWNVEMSGVCRESEKASCPARREVTGHHR